MRGIGQSRVMGKALQNLQSEIGQPACIRLLHIFTGKDPSLSVKLILYIDQQAIEFLNDDFNRGATYSRLSSFCVND